MRGGGAPVIDVRLRDALSKERLFDAEVALIDADGEILLTFDGDSSISGTLSGTGEIVPLPPGEYTLTERHPPRSAPGLDDVRFAYWLAAPIAFTVQGPNDRLELELLHDRAGLVSTSDEREGEFDTQQVDESEGRARRFWKSFMSLVCSGRKKKKLDPGLSRVQLCRTWMLASMLSLVLSFWILAPIIWMTCFGFASFFDPSLGPLFAFRNLVDYVTGGFAVRGWTAVAILAGAYQIPFAVHSLCFLASSFEAAFGIRFVNKRAQKKLMANDLLDSLPPAAGHNECGSARFIRAPEEIENTLMTCDADIPVGSIEYAGPVFGFLDEPLARTAVSVARLDVEFLQRALKSVRDGRPYRVVPRSRFDSVVTAGKFVYSDGDENTLIIGDTRAGKTRRTLLATIDLLTRAVRESLLILDPKGELFALTSDEVARRGITVNRIDFRFPRFSKRWNPMQLVIDAAVRARSAKKAGDERALHEAYDAMNSAAEDLTLMILPKENDIGPNTFFNQGARSYIKSVMLFVACWDNCPDNQRSLATVSRVIDNYGAARTVDQDSPTAEKLTPYIWMLDYLPRDHPAYEAFSNARSAVDKERSQFVTTALGVLQDYRDSNIAAMTSDTDVPLKQLGLERSVTYLIIPHEKSTYSAFATLFIQQAYQALIEESTLHGGRLPYRVNFLCEEFGQIPPLADLDQKLSTSLSAGIRWFIILQSIAQLITKYGRGFDDTVKTNCENKIVIKTTDADNTGKWISSLAGKYTIALEGGSISGKRISLWKNSASLSSRLGARELIDPSEVARWRADYGALMHRGASDGMYVIPLPDVSRTPTQKAFGLGDKEHNRRKTERVLYGCEPPIREEIDPWSPELNKMKEKTARGERYTDEEKRIAEAVFLRRLIERKEQAQKRARAGLKAKRTESAPQTKYGCLLDAISFQTTPIVPVASSEYLSSLQQHPTWERIEMNEAHAVKNALKQRKDTIMQQRQKAKSEASAKREKMEASRPSSPFSRNDGNSGRRDRKRAH